jgi:hypothetical protein
MRPTELRNEKPLPQPRKAGRRRRSVEMPFAAVAQRPASSAREKDEGYGAVVAVLSGKLRVIAGSCGLQWGIQSRVTPKLWKSFAYCALAPSSRRPRLRPGSMGHYRRSSRVFPEVRSALSCR